MPRNLPSALTIDLMSPVRSHEGIDGVVTNEGLISVVIRFSLSQARPLPAGFFVLLANTGRDNAMISLGEIHFLREFASIECFFHRLDGLPVHDNLAVLAQLCELFVREYFHHAFGIPEP